jgi:hypothetical protein
MALENSDLQAIKDFFGGELKAVEERLLGVVESRIGDVPAETAAVSQDRVAQVGAPDVDPEAGPEYYVHLADGSVVVSHDSGSTHMPNAEGEPVAVIGRYQKGA